MMPPQPQLKKKQRRKAPLPTMEASSTTPFLPQMSDNSVLHDDGPPEFEPVSLATIMAEHVKYDPNCFGCKMPFAKPADVTQDPDMALLWAAFAENRGRLSDAETYNIMYRVHRDKYVEPTKDDDEPIEEWTEAEIEEHVNYHMFDYDLEVLDDIKTLKYMKEFYKTRVGNMDTKTGIIVDNKDASEMLIKIIDKRQAIMTRYQKEKQQASQQQH